MGDAPIADAPAVDLLDDEPLEIELATTLLYEHCHFPYRQIRERLQSLNARQRDEIIALGTKHRGRHDELLRAYCWAIGCALTSSWTSAASAICTATAAAFRSARSSPPAHGYDTPAMITGEPLQRYRAAMDRARGMSRG